jgi:hypothetical protein
MYAMVQISVMVVLYRSTLLCSDVGGFLPLIRYLLLLGLSVFFFVYMLCDVAFVS